MAKQSSGSVKRWQKRYFVASGHYIKYYDSKQAFEAGEMPKGAIDLALIDSISHDGGGPDQDETTSPKRGSGMTDDGGDVAPDPEEDILYSIASQSNVKPASAAFQLFYKSRGANSASSARFKCANGEDATAWVGCMQGKLLILVNTVVGANPCLSLLILASLRPANPCLSLLILPSLLPALSRYHGWHRQGSDSRAHSASEAPGSGKQIARDDGATESEGETNARYNGAVYCNTEFRVFVRI
jgi:hypothetical protein